MKKKFLSLIHIFFININLISYAFSYLNIPFKTKPSIIKDTETNITRLFRSLIYNNIYINLEIGEPKQIVEAFLDSQDINFYFSEKTKNDPKTNISNPNHDDVGCELENFFDKSKSNTFEITDKTKSLNYGYNGKISYDYFYFKDENNNELKEKIEFILSSSTMGNRPSIIGLQYPRAFNGDNNFFNLLKQKEIINSYFWMINYTSENEGNFIIGELPHKFSNIYKEEDLLIGHPYTYKAMQEYWGLRMDDILFQDINFRPNHECYFYHELNIIEGIQALEKQIDKYLNDSINKGICFKNYIKYSYGPHKFYYCDKEKYKEKVKEFPPLRFVHKEMNYTFELTYEDLFIEKYDKLILLIFFEETGSTWKMGKPFLKKYSFIMNHDMKTVGFYKNFGKIKDQTTNDENTKKNLALTIVVIALGVIVLVALGILIGKYLFKKRKRINTIDDEYDYSGSINDNIIN